MSQACHISTSRSCPAPSWAPESSSYSARLTAQLSVDSGGSLSLQPRPVPPPAYSEASTHRGGLSAPSFTTLTSLTSPCLTPHNNNHS